MQCIAILNLNSPTISIILAQPLFNLFFNALKGSFLYLNVLQTNMPIFAFQLVVDASLKPGCPTVLYSSNEDQHILPRMLFTPVHHTDIYMALGNQVGQLNNSSPQNWGKIPFVKCVCLLSHMSHNKLKML